MDGAATELVDFFPEYSPGFFSRRRPYHSTGPTEQNREPLTLIQQIIAMIKIFAAAQNFVFILPENNTETACQLITPEGTKIEVAQNDQGSPEVSCGGNITPHAARSLKKVALQIFNSNVFPCGENGKIHIRIWAPTIEELKILAQTFEGDFVIDYGEIRCPGHDTVYLNETQLNNLILSSSAPSFSSGIAAVSNVFSHSVEPSAPPEDPPSYKEAINSLDSSP